MLDAVGGVTNRAPLLINYTPAQNPQINFDTALYHQNQQPQVTPVKQDTSERTQLEQDSDGKIDYTVVKDDNLTVIARKFGRTVEELLVANPNLRSHPGSINPGDKITILNDDRTQLAMQMAKTNDPQKLQDLVTREILYATRNSRTPADELPGLEKELIARRPGDDSFAKLVKDAGTKLTQLWQAQGRTHQVWDKLLQLTQKKDQKGLEAEITKQITALAWANPTVKAVQDYKQMLLAYAPKDDPSTPVNEAEVFNTAVNQAVDQFLNKGPAAAAQQLKTILDSPTLTQLKNNESIDIDKEGPIGAAAKLREMTDPTKVDPLTAALILKNAKDQGVLDGIVNQAGNLIWNPQDGVHVHLGNQDLDKMLSDLNAAIDNASRSPEAQPTIDYVAGKLADHGGYGFITQSVTNGDGVILPLAMAKHLKAEGKTDAADVILILVNKGVQNLKSNIKDHVNHLGKDILPLTNPASNWEDLIGDPKGPANQPFKTPDQTLKKWLQDHPEFINKVDGDLKQLNTDGYQLTRALEGLNQYVPQLGGLDHQGDLRQTGQMPDQKSDPQLSFALAVSKDGVLEAARLFNVQGLQSGSLEDPNKVVPDPSWPLRMVRNHIQADIRAATGVRPFGLGLSLYGTVTYLWGVVDQGTERSRNIGDPGWYAQRGWRVDGFLAMYTSGTVIEGTQVASVILSQKFGWDGTEAGLKGFLGRTAANQGIWSKIFANHLKLFGWWNVLGTANYFLHGDWQKGTALGVAAAGTLLSSYAEALGLGSWAGPVGTLLTLLGSSAILALNIKEKADRAAMSEPWNKDYLIAAGVRPEIANALANNNGDGQSVASLIKQLANYRGVTPQEMLQWFNQQDADWVNGYIKFVFANNGIKPNDNGVYPVTSIGEDWKPTSLTNLANIAERTGHPLPIG